MNAVGGRKAPARSPDDAIHYHTQQPQNTAAQDACRAYDAVCQSPLSQPHHHGDSRCRIEDVGHQKEVDDVVVLQALSAVRLDTSAELQNRCPVKALKIMRFKGGNFVLIEGGVRPAHMSSCLSLNEGLQPSHNASLPSHFYFACLSRFTSMFEDLHELCRLSSEQTSRATSSSLQSMLTLRLTIMHGTLRPSTSRRAHQTEYFFSHTPAMLSAIAFWWLSTADVDIVTHRQATIVVIHTCKGEEPCLNDL